MTNKDPSQVPKWKLDSSGYRQALIYWARYIHDERDPIDDSDPIYDWLEYRGRDACVRLVKQIAGRGSDDHQQAIAYMKQKDDDALIDQAHRLFLDQIGLVLGLVDDGLVKFAE